MVQKVNAMFAAAAPWITNGVLVLFSVIGYFLLQEFATVRNLEKDVVMLKTDSEVMKGNRFTSADGLEVWKEIQAIRTSIAEMSARIPERTPPVWFEEKVNGIGEDVDENSGKLDQVLTEIHSNALLINGVRTKLDSHSNHIGIGGP